MPYAPLDRHLRKPLTRANAPHTFGAMQTTEGFRKSVGLALAVLFSASNLILAEQSSSVTHIELPASPAADAINSLGLDLLRKTSQPERNALLSPYSIQSALAMTYAGAAGATRAEMAKALHFPANEIELHRSFANLRNQLNKAAAQSAKQAQEAKKYGVTNDPMTLTVANRLFGQTGYQFYPAFLDTVKDNYGAPFLPLDFVKNANGATKEINDWVSDQTHQRIQNLISPSALNDLTRLVLVNAIYLKAPWMKPFPSAATSPQPFQIYGGKAEKVPTMVRQGKFGFAKHAGFRVISIPYNPWSLQFVIFLPDSPKGLAAVESKLTPAMLGEYDNLKDQEIILHLPKFKMEPSAMRLSTALQALGMKSAFDQPKGSADFSRLASRKADDYLSVSDVFHKAFISVDEKGTEAAAATAVVMMTLGIAHEPPKPIEIKVDHPFLFAIQDRQTGACLFLGHVFDPR